MTPARFYHGDDTMKRLLIIPILVFAAILVFRCGDDSTTTPDTEVSVTSYVERVYGANFVIGQPLPEPSGTGTVSIDAADSLLGKGGIFQLTINHGPDVADVIIGVVDAVGYFLLPIPEGQSQTTFRGELNQANTECFAWYISARDENEVVFEPAMHDVRVLSDRVVKFYIENVEGSEYHEAELPEPVKFNTIASVEGDLTIINGGSAVVDLMVNVPAQAVIVGIPDAFGYFRLPLSDMPGLANVLIYIAQSATNPFPGILFMTEEPGDPDYGTAIMYDPIFLSVGSGEVQVSLTFFPDQDLDLHLVEPTGEEIYFGNPVSAAGGKLDLDANAACASRGQYNENITYTGVTPPSGEYIVRVDFWASCDGEGAEYRVLVNVRGEGQLYEGDFRADEAGGGSTGEEVCRFTY